MPASHRVSPQERRCYEESINLKQKPEISDTPGLAMSYGGLGRLELFVEPTNVAKAGEYLELDLEYSEQTGDIAGQTIMHSLIGYCQLLEDNVTEAQKRYERSLELASNPIARFHALHGLVRALARNPRNEELQGRALELGELMEKESLPENLRDILADTLRLEGARMPAQVRDVLETAFKEQGD